MGCTINNDLAQQLETYRAMKKGNTAPDIVFNGDILRQDTSQKIPQKNYQILKANIPLLFLELVGAQPVLMKYQKLQNSIRNGEKMIWKWYLFPWMKKRKRTEVL